MTRTRHPETRDIQTELAAARMFTRRYAPDAVKAGSVFSVQQLARRLSRENTLRVIVEQACSEGAAQEAVDKLVHSIASGLQGFNAPSEKVLMDGVTSVLSLLAEAFSKPSLIRSSSSPVRVQILDRAKQTLAARPQRPVSEPQVPPVEQARSAQAKMPRAASPAAQGMPEVPSSVQKELPATPASSVVQAVKPPQTLALQSDGSKQLESQLAAHLVNGLTPDFDKVRAALQRFEASVKSWKLVPLGPEESLELGQASESLIEYLKPLAAKRTPHEETARRNKLLIEVAQKLGPVRGEGIPPQLLEALTRADEAELVLRALRVCASLESLGFPKWVWPGCLPEPARGSRPVQVGHLLVQRALLDELAACVSWAESLEPALQPLLGECPPEGQVNGSLLERLRVSHEHAVARFSENHQRRTRLAAVAEFLDPTLVDFIASGKDRDGLQLLERAEAAVARLTALRPRLHADIYTDLLRELRALPAELDEAIGALERAVVTVGPELARAISQRPALVLMAERLTSVPHHIKPAFQDMAGPARAFLRVEHPMSRRSGGSTPTYAADLIWVQVAGAPYGRVSFPIRLVLSEKTAKDLELKLEVTSDILAGIPAGWLEGATNRLLRVPMGAEYLDVEISLPLAKAPAELIEKENKNIELRLFITGSDGVRTEHGCSWQGLRRGLTEYTPPFPQTVEPEWMRANPLGVEKRFQEVCSLVEDGERSFIVAGPRRFGKTTLISALVEHAAKLKSVLVLRSVIASAMPDAAGVWEEVAKQLRVQLKRPVDSSLVDGLLPADSAFDDVRAEASARGIKSIYILIDEAQALFSASGRPHMLGEALKQRLENAWGLRGQGRAAIRIGLIGQAHLPELMGSNLVGAFPSAFMEDHIGDEDLLPILRNENTGGVLQSTAEARKRLAALAGNLWILDKLLTEVWRGCQQRGRNWFSEEDVERAASRLVEADRAGTDETLWSYVRDVLNDNDDRKVWRPAETYPVAMAWAFLRRNKASKGPMNSTDLLPVLERWAKGVTLLKERVDDAIRQLLKQRVVRPDGAFHIPMLERLLAVRADALEPLVEDTEREVLARLGFRRVKRPLLAAGQDGMVVSGGQAEIFRGQLKDGHVAVRCVRLDTSKAQERFLREVRLLERLDATTSELAPRARAFLPNVRATGLDDENPGIGLVIYDWIVGSQLAEKSLNEVSAVFVASCLAEALQFLESANILHRDIQPKNVLIRKQTGEPVLLDFGLSQSIEDISKNSHSLVGVAAYLPPEVLKSGAKAWTPKGDIYSLGRALDFCLLEGPRTGKLAHLISRMCAEAPGSRPSAAELARELSVLAEALQLNQRRDAVLRRFEEVLETLPVAVRKAAHASRGDFSACKMGTITSREARLCTVATFLENIFQSYVRSQHAEFARTLGEGGRGTYLVRMSDGNGTASIPSELQRFVSREAVAVGRMRNADAHPADFGRLMTDVWRALGQIRPQRVEQREGVGVLDAAVQNVTTQLAKFLSTPKLASLVTDWLNPGLN